ncbi:MAG: SpoIIE family protein phosphatase [Candidatus Eisenbacteria sp.]|nr:SpoIIE family protein phosphatase [Candidatus Eisenbacteria bacterium]
MSYRFFTAAEPDAFPERLEPGRHRIGRGSQNDIVVVDPSVSREHAEVIVEADRVAIRDLGSSNGTWVNGQRITEEIDLRAGDRLRLGNLELALADDDGSAAGGGGAAGGPPIELQTTFNAPSASLAPHDGVNTQEKLSWEEARSDIGSRSRIGQMLLRAVTEAGQLLVLPRPLEETFDQVLGAVERVIPSRRILLLLTDTPDGSPVIRAARPAGQSSSEQLILSQTILGTVLHEQQALLLNDVQSDPRFGAQESVILQNLRSAMVAPLFDNQQVIGLLYADTDDPRVRYDRDQLRAFTLLGNLIAVKITNARLLEAQREQERMEQEVAAAASVQQTLLAGDLPTIQGYEIAARQLPCFEVAGDLYDITRLDDGRIALVVGDVTGKGLGAAMLMSNVLAGLRVLYQQEIPPAVLAERIHRQLLRSSEDTRFVTLFLGFLDPATHVLEFVNAGHNAPFLLRDGEEVSTLEATGMPLGLLPQATYEAGRIEMPPGALLCVFSDGIPEAMVGEEFYGEERFLKSLDDLRRQGIEQIVDGTLEDLTRFLGEVPPADDITLLLLRRTS